MSWDERRIIDEATIVREGHKKLVEIMNPKEFEEPVRQALPNNKAAELLLEKFEIRNFVYDELFPDEKTLPEAGRPIAEEVIRKSLRTDLKIAIAIPKTLFESEGRTVLKLALRFHGGGGTTGRPLFDAFSYLADVKYVLEKGMALLDAAYLLQPHNHKRRNSETMDKMWAWIFDNLQTKLESLNVNFVADYGSLSVRGGSYGGTMAMLAWLRYLKISDRGTNSCIHTVVCRAPPMDHYSRDLGPYAGIEVSQERVEKDSSAILDLVKKMPYMVCEAEKPDERDMYGGACLAMADCHKDLAREESVLDMLKEVLIMSRRSAKCWDKPPRFLFTIGGEDAHVKYEDLDETVQVLRELGLHAELHVQPGKTHAWDVNEPLGEVERNFLNASQAS